MSFSVTSAGCCLFVGHRGGSAPLCGHSMPGRTDLLAQQSLPSLLLLQGRDLVLHCFLKQNCR